LKTRKNVKRQFLIDTDTASDDAVALIMALRSPEVEVLAITTVAGNVDVRQATRNALYTAELCDAKVPVFAGAARPLERSTWTRVGFMVAMGLGTTATLRPHGRQKGRARLTQSFESLSLTPAWKLSHWRR
jgi:purine nucleosidase